ncbi:DUF3108 domain-containing protein [Azonexus sp.]|uniref:DUF3108 domain-containing protein n=1 Tax=Azonexus sp. TaxID=1872668 RepID=UPI0039E51E58
MRHVLIIAVFFSLLLHGLALLSFDFGMFGEPPETPSLHAEIRPPAALVPPLAEMAAAERPVKKEKPQAKPDPKTATKSAQEIITSAATADEKTASTVSATAPESANHPAPERMETAATPEHEKTPPAAAFSALLPGEGRLEFVVIKESLGMQIGRAEHRWRFEEDGSYQLNSRIETSGLAAFFKPLRQEHESRGRLGPQGLQPETFRVLRNGQPRGEDAEFDWAANEVIFLQRDPRRYALKAGSQDVLSLNYQLAYLPRLEEGVEIGVVTGKKYERYALDALGEENLTTPAGVFRTLHLRAAGETLTEIWLALDYRRLPVKIRFTDKKGDSYSQLLSKMNAELADAPLAPASADTATPKNE